MSEAIEKVRLELVKACESNTIMEWAAKMASPQGGLLPRGSDLTNILDDTLVERQWNALYRYCRFGMVAETIALLDLGASASLPMPRHNREVHSSALHVSMFNFKLDIVIALRRYGAVITEKNDERDLPIHDALAPGGRFGLPRPTPQHHALTCKAAIHILADKDIEEENPVRMLCQLSTLTPQQCMMLETHVQQSPEMVMQLDLGSSWTALHTACATGNQEALSCLLKSRGLSDTSLLCRRDEDGWTPLHCLVARSAVLPKENEKLLAMGRALVERCPNIIYPFTASGEPMRHRLLHRMFLGTVALKMYRLYVIAATDCDEPKVERFTAWLWIDDLRHIDVILSFYPSKERKIAVTASEGKEREVNYLPNYYIDEVHNMLRPADTSYDLLPPKDSEEVLRCVPTCLPCCDEKFNNMEWRLGKRLVRQWQFISLNNERQRFTVLNCATNDVHIVTLEMREQEMFVLVVDTGDAPDEVVRFSDLWGTFGACHDVTPATIPRGQSVISWVVQENLTDWFSLFPENCLSTDDNAQNDVLCAALKIFSALDKEKRARMESFLRSTGAIHDGSKTRIYRPATDEQGPAYLTLCLEPDAKAARRLFRDLHFIPEGTSERDVQERENSLLDLLHNACAVGRRRVVERVIQLLRVYPEWNNGDLLSRSLRVTVRGRTREQYAVSIAAAFGNASVLELLKQHDCEMMAGDGLALRRAIQNQRWDAAEWIVRRCWAGKLLMYPSLELRENSDRQPVSVEEVRFCHDHGLLAATYEEEYVCNSVHWDNGGDEEDTTEVTSSKIALMVIDLQLDFFQGTEHYPSPGLPVTNGTEELAQRAANFIRDVGPFVSCIFVARDWHPQRHFSFASSHPDKKPFETIIDHRNGLTQTLWPDHCVQNHKGSYVHPLVEQALNETRKELVFVDSGTNPDVDSYSAFYDNNKMVKSRMHGELLKRGIEDVYMFGIATDFCVAYSALDALTLGFDVVVVQDLCAAVNEEFGAKQLDMVNRRGGQVMTSRQVRRFLQSIKKGDALMRVDSAGFDEAVGFSFQNTRIVRELFALRTIRYYMLFESSINSAKLTTRLNMFDFGSNNPREGELYLYLSSFACQQKRPFRFRIHGLWLQNFEPFDSEQALAYPLHYLMMLARYSRSAVHASNAMELLISTIRFINDNHADAFDHRGQERFRFPLRGFEESKSLTRFARDIPTICRCDDPVSCMCLFHISVLKDERLKKTHPLLSLDMDAVKLFDHKPLVATRPSRGTCALALKKHISPEASKESSTNSQDGEERPMQHILECTPLMLAVRLRLSKIVAAMLLCSSDRPPIVWEEEVVGKDVSGERFSYQSFSDLWHAVPEEKRPDGTVAPGTSPAFHFLLRSTKPMENSSEVVCDDFHIVASPECDEYIAVQTAPPGMAPISSYTFHPGCGARRGGLDDLLARAEEDNQQRQRAFGDEILKLNLRRKSRFDVLVEEEEDEEDMPGWEVPCGLQWLCPECGALLHDCYEVPPFDLLHLRRHLNNDSLESLNIARIFLKACTLYERPLFVGGVRSECVQVDTESVSRWVDLSGLYCWSGAYFSNRTGKYHRGDSGLALLFQYMPDMVPQLSNLGVLEKCPITSYTDLNEKVQSSTCSILIRRRHLFKISRGGAQLIVYDRGLSVMQYCALINAIGVAQWLLRFPDFDALDECPSERLGYYALHFAAFGSSIDVMRLLMAHVARKYSGDVLARWVNKQAVHDADVTTLTYNSAFPNSAGDFDNMQYRCLDRHHDPAADPYDYRQNQSSNAFYGRFNAIGETAMHVSAAFGHERCITLLLEHKGDVSIQTSLEGLDAHDIAVTLQHRFEMQQVESQSRRDDGDMLFTNWKEEARLEKEKQDEQILNEVVERLNQEESITGKLQQHGTMRFFVEHGFYFMFVILLVIYTFLFNNHGLTEARGDYFALRAVSDAVHDASVAEISSMSDLTQWIQGPLRGTLFPNQTSPYLLDGNYRLIGAVRLQQLRVQGETCSKLSKYSLDPPSQCYPSWSYGNNEEEPYNNFIFRTTIDTRVAIEAQSLQTLHEYTVREGYVLDLKHMPDTATYEAQFQAVSTFIVPSTRFLCVIFTTYAVNMDRFVNVRMCFEVLPSGIVTRTEKLTPLQTASKSGITLVVYVVLVVMVSLLLVTEMTDVYYSFVATRREIRDYIRALHDEIMSIGEKDESAIRAVVDSRGFLPGRTALVAELKALDRIPVCSEHSQTLRQGFAQRLKKASEVGYVGFIVTRGVIRHFASEWNFVDVTVLFLMVSAFIYDDTIDQNFVDVDIVFRTAEYVDFTLLGSAWTLANLCLCVAVLFSMMTLLKLVHFVPHVGPLAAAIVGTLGTREVLTYVAILFLVITAFLFTITNAFGYQLEAYRSVHSTFFRVFQQALGDTDYYDMTAVHFQVGPVLFIVIVGFVNILLLNTFIAVLGEVYNEKIAQAHSSWSQRMVASYREVVLGLPPLDTFNGTILRTSVLRFMHMVTFGRVKLHFRGRVYEDTLDVPPVAELESHKGREAATKEFFYKNPHLSPWNCVPQSVNDVVEASRRNAGVTAAAE
eukprot:PhM_4_TR13925/c7_g1_i4/m.100667